MDTAFVVLILGVVVYFVFWVVIKEVEVDEKAEQRKQEEALRESLEELRKTCAEVTCITQEEYDALSQDFSDDQIASFVGLREHLGE